MREMFDDIIELVSVYKDTGKVKFDESVTEEGETEKVVAITVSMAGRGLAMIIR